MTRSCPMHCSQPTPPELCCGHLTDTIYPSWWLIHGEWHGTCIWESLWNFFPIFTTCIWVSSGHQVRYHPTLMALYLLSLFLFIFFNYFLSLRKVAWIWNSILFHKCIHIFIYPQAMCMSSRCMNICIYLGSFILQQCQDDGYGFVSWVRKQIL